MQRRVAPPYRSLRGRSIGAMVMDSFPVQLRMYVASSSPTASAGGSSSHFASARLFTDAAASLSPMADGASSAPPSPFEVHQVIARAAQRGQWEHAICLLVGSLHSHCVPLAETYQLTLLAALRGGGWQASVQLTKRVATSSLSTTALYHAAADLLLAKPTFDLETLGKSLDRVVLEELVPLMLADATQHVVWRPRHREAALRALGKAEEHQKMSALFRRWTAATALCGGVSQLRCSEEEATLFMAAFGVTGDWRSAETLRASLSQVSAPLLVSYVRAFTVAVQHAKTSSRAEPQQIVPWEMALDIAAAGRQEAPVLEAVTELLSAARHAAVPADGARWWWAASTSTHAKLAELRRRVAISAREAAQLLVECHVTTAQVRSLLDAVRVSGVLSSAAAEASPYYEGWVNVVLVLSQYCPHALVSVDGCADGLVPLLPHTLGLWRQVAQSAAGGDVAKPASVAWYVVYTSSVLHYLRHASLQPAQLAKAESTLSAALARQLRCASHHPIHGALLTGFAGKPGALFIFLRTVSAHISVPSAEHCVTLVMRGEAASIDEMVDERLLSFLEPLDALGTPEELCEAVCAAGEAALLSSPPSYSSTQFVCLAVWYTCHQLRRGVSLVALRPALRRTVSLVERLPGSAEALTLLSAQLQWCWGASLEALREQAVPVLLRREEWDVLARLLERFPQPLSTREQHILQRCKNGAKVTALQNLVTAHRATAAWEYWQGELRGAAREAPLPTSLRDSLVSLLLAHGLVTEAHAVLAVSRASEVRVSHTTWSRTGLRVYDYARRWRRCEQGMQLAELWDVAALGGEEEADGDGSEVRRREITVILALYAGLALEHTHRAADASQVIAAAVDYVLRYDEAHHHRGTQPPLDFATLHRTDAQLAARLPDYVQCAAPRLICAALNCSGESSRQPATRAACSGVDSGGVSEALRIVAYLLPLTSTSGAAVMAWSETVLRLHTVASACAVEAMPAVATLGQRLLYQAAAQNVTVAPSFLRLVLATGPLSTRLLAAVRQCLLLRLGNAPTGPSSTDVAATAVQVAVSLADSGNHSAALEWVEEFELWQRGEAAGKEGTAPDQQTVVDMATQLSWLQAAQGAAQRRVDQRAALCQHRRKAQAAASQGSVASELYAWDALDRLIDCDAWEEALDAFLQVVAAPTDVKSLFSKESMELMELRDAYLSADVLNSVMLCVARCAPWRTTVQAWMLLASQVPLLPWNACAAALTPSIHELLRVMARQCALPHEVGTVVMWMAAQLDLPRSATSPLCALFADCIGASSSTGAGYAWTAAEAQLCAEIIAQLRRLCGEKRVEEAGRAIAEAQAVLFPPSLYTPAPHSEEGTVPSAASWLPPGRPPLSVKELDTLAVVAPLLLLASTPQLESLAQQHLGGTFQGHELKALLYLYREELLQRVAAVREPDAALVQYLAQNATLRVLLSQCVEVKPAMHPTPRARDRAAAEWMAQHVFDGFLPLSTAEELWRACEEPAKKLAECRWSAVAEAELCEELLRRHGRPPEKLSTAPHLTRQAISHYWSCFHRVLLPEMHFGPLELCCLASYAPALAEARAACPDMTQPAYANAVAELANHAYKSHFCPSRVPVEDTLSYLRRPHCAAAVAAVMTSAFKKLKVLHTQLSDVRSAAARGYRLPFPWKTVPVAAVKLPPELDRQCLADAARRIAHDAAPVTKAAPVRASHTRIASPLLRRWTQWATGMACASSPKSLPQAASLLLVEWTKEALHSGCDLPRADQGLSAALTAAGDNGTKVCALWREMARAGKRELQLQRCRDLSVAWQLLAGAKVWRFMDPGHVMVLRRLVCPSNSKVTALPSKRDAARHHRKTSQRREERG
ncbi:conserved hypothetical protein [Leishmania mexicana MHOM/GT/2001/U1103]|uniref:Uncharacterized protein n=1 Tax=Leishmania mexicana (strain MHOM/GT/2001/U1103) TaxID=929439 RepID=E9AJZ3_LEIMU|nr:conserved hypothetical protein [Leishmania mexicana MHOM/GT/2001/U1103]CBZ23243.1 conserved hypothetical protein [Leishmania mexicana MHOM/GT/2001/U1103]